jgi:WD40 repeat protein
MGTKNLLFLVTDDGNGFHQCAFTKQDHPLLGHVGKGDRKLFGATSDGGYWLEVVNDTDLNLRENKLAANNPDGPIKYTFKHKEKIDFAGADEKYEVVTISGGVLRLWDVESDPSKPAKEDTLPFKPTVLAVCPIGAAYLVGGDNGETRIYSSGLGGVTTLKRHDGPVTAVAMTRDGKWVVTGSADKTARVWSMPDGKEVAVLKGHTGAVTAVAFRGYYGDRIATGSADKTVKVWEVKAPAPVESAWKTKHIFEGKNRIAAVAFGPDRIAAGDEDGVLTIWNPTTGAEKERVNVGRWKFKPILGVQFLPNRTVRAIAGSTENWQTISFLDFRPPFNAEKMDIMSTQTPFGATADGDFNLIYDNDRRDIALWENDPDAGKKGGNTRKAQFGHEALVEFAAADSASAVATITNPRSEPELRFWSIAKKEPLWTVALKKKVGAIDVLGVFVAPGGKLVAVSGTAGQLWVFDAKAGKLVSKANKLTGAVSSAAFSPDGKQIVAGCADGTAHIFNTETGDELAVLKGHTDLVSSVAFAPDGKMIVTGSADKTVRVWSSGSK